MGYKYLEKDRPPIPPTIADAVNYLRPNTSWHMPEGGVPVFYHNDNRTVNENIIPPDQKELEEILDKMIEEWDVEKQRIELRNSYLEGIKEHQWRLWQDIDAGIIPGKEGKFYTHIKNAIDQYPGDVKEPYCP